MATLTLWTRSALQLDGQDYGRLEISDNGKTESAQVYNAFGTRACGGCGVRISSTLAEELGINLGDTIKIDNLTPLFDQRERKSSGSRSESPSSSQDGVLRRFLKRFGFQFH